MLMPFMSPTSLVKFKSAFKVMSGDVKYHGRGMALKCTKSATQVLGNVFPLTTTSSSGKFPVN